MTEDKYMYPVLLGEAMKMLSHSLYGYHSVLANEMFMVGYLYGLTKVYPIFKSSVTAGQILRSSNYKYWEAIVRFDEEGYHEEVVDLLRKAVELITLKEERCLSNG